MSHENLELWNLLATTPPEVTRPSQIVQADGTCLTLVKPQYRSQKLTEVFGVGGWGWNIHSRWIDDWGSIKCANVELSVWYRWKDQLHETGKQIGGQSIVNTSPDSIWMSCITRAIAKCAASIGLCADVYMGEFPDSIPEQPQAGYSSRVPVQPGPVFDQLKKELPPVKEPAAKKAAPPEEKAYQEPLAAKEKAPAENPKQSEPAKEKAAESPRGATAPANTAAICCPTCKAVTPDITIGKYKTAGINSCWKCGGVKFDNSGNLI